MKKFLKGLIFAFAGVFALTLASCGEKHSPETGWNRDSTAHWHTCADEGCEELLDYETHVYNNWVKDNAQCFESRKCDICGFVIKRNVAHEWSDWATQKDGSLGKTCTHCGEVEKVAQYYLKGAIAGNSGIVWDKSEAGAFVFDQETMSSSITITLAVGDQFKVGTASGWEYDHSKVENAKNWFDAASDGNLVCKEAADYQVTITGLEGSDHKCSVKQLCKHTFGEFTLKATEADPCAHVAVCSKCQVETTKTIHNWEKPTGTYEQCTRCEVINIADFYLKGSVASNEKIVWDKSEDGKFDVQGDKKSSVLTVELAVGDEFKIGTAGGWEFNASNIDFGTYAEAASEANDANVKVTKAGVYLITVTGLDTGEYAVKVEQCPVYVRGSFDSSWNCLPDYKLAEGYSGKTTALQLNNVYFEKDTEFKISTPYWKVLNFGFADIEEPVEGLFTDSNGNIKVNYSGYYKISILDFASAETAKLTITCLYKEVSLADVLTSKNATSVIIEGKVKEIKEDGKVVLTDGATTPTEVVITEMCHIHEGDTVKIKGKVTVNENDVNVEFKGLENVLAAEGNSLEGTLTKVTEASQLVDGAKVVLAYDNYVMGSQNGDIRDIMYSEDKLDKHLVLVTLVKSGDAWLLKTGENEYLYYTGKDNEVYSGNVTDNTAKWTITVKEGYVTIVNVANTERYLQFNIGKPRVACYKTTSNQYNPELYIYTAE